MNETESMLGNLRGDIAVINSFTEQFPYQFIIESDEQKRERMKKQSNRKPSAPLVK